MTTIRLAQRRLAITIGSLSVERAAICLVMALAALALALSLAGAVRAEEEKAPAAAAPAPTIAPARAAALIDATSGTRAGEVRATGSEAEKINAALPFSTAPVQSARPFEAPVGGTSYDRALTCLTQAVYYEAGFEPISGRRAVAQVVLNRARHPAFPKSICGVVYQRNATPVCQFSFVCDGSLSRAPAAGAWAEARKVAAAALGGFVETSVGSATHYHADYVAPRWAPLLAKITRIGAHIFYRWPGSWGLPGAFTGRYAGEPADPLALRPADRTLIVAERGSEGEIVIAAPAVNGPPVARAANDVGGLLDTSKGWTLDIPMPGDSSSRSQEIALRQKGESDSAGPQVAALAGASAPVTAR